MPENMELWIQIHQAMRDCTKSIHEEHGVIPCFTILGAYGEHKVFPFLDSDDETRKSTFAAIRAYMIWAGAHGFLIVYADEDIRGEFHVIAVSRHESVWIRQSFDEDSQELVIPKWSPEVPDDFAGLLPALDLPISATELQLLETIERGEKLPNLIIVDKKQRAARPKISCSRVLH